MTPHQKKLHDCLITIGHQAEKIDPPSKDELKILFDQFMETEELGKLSQIGKELSGGLVRWMVEKL